MIINGLYCDCRDWMSVKNARSQGRDTRRGAMGLLVAGTAQLRPPVRSHDTVSFKIRHNLWLIALDCPSALRNGIMRRACFKIGGASRGPSYTVLFPLSPVENESCYVLPNLMMPCNWHAYVSGANFCSTAPLMMGRSAAPFIATATMSPSTASTISTSAV